MTMETSEAICEQCGGAFTYRRRRTPRRLCPGCRQENQTKSIEANRRRIRLQDGETRTCDGDGPEMNMSCAEVAMIERVTKQAVQQATRYALVKIRGNPELRRLFGEWVAEGAPVPVRGDAGAELLDWELKLAGLWEIQDRLVAAECPEEAAECLGEIAKFQSLVARALAEVAGRPDGLMAARGQERAGWSTGGRSSNRKPRWCLTCSVAWVALVEAFIAEGYRAVGFDIESPRLRQRRLSRRTCLARHPLPERRGMVKTYGVPAVIVASPPCQEFGYIAALVRKAKEKMRKIQADPAEPKRLTDLSTSAFGFNAKK